jgi:hypothetical protein
MQRLDALDVVCVPHLKVLVRQCNQIDSCHVAEQARLLNRVVVNRAPIFSFLFAGDCSI